MQSQDSRPYFARLQLGKKRLAGGTASRKLLIETVTSRIKFRRIFYPTAPSVVACGAGWTMVSMVSRSNVGAIRSMRIDRGTRIRTFRELGNTCDGAAVVQHGHSDAHTQFAQDTPNGDANGLRYRQARRNNDVTQTCKHSNSKMWIRRGMLVEL